MSIDGLAPPPPLHHARRLLAESPLIDGHNDFPYVLRGFYANKLDGANLYDMPIGQTDIVRLRQGRIGGQFWSVYVPCRPVERSSLSDTQIPDETDLRAIHDTLQQIDLVHRMIARYSQVFGLVHRADDIKPIFESGRIASCIGVEGLHQIGNSVAVLRNFHRLGVRYVTLTHDKNNRFGDSANASSAWHGGLSDRGRRLVGEMNRIGMMIDLSHTTEAVQLQVLEISTAPVIFSHSSCLCAHPRNVSDRVLARLKANGGLLMICFLPELSKPASASGDSSSMHSIVDHFMYAVDQIGVAHVGIGSDLDGMLEGPRGADDVACYPALVAELLRRNVAEDHVKAVMGLNLIRVMAAVEARARHAQAHGAAEMNDDILPVWTPEQRQMLLEQGRKRGMKATNPEK